MLGAKNIEWVGSASQGHLRLLDQTRLPGEIEFLDCPDVESIAAAIKRLSVRGAPAIGVAAAYGCVIGVQGGDDNNTANQLRHASNILAQSRPTAVNLFWALERIKRVKPCTAESLLAEAKKIHEEDALMCQRIGEYGVTVLNRHLDDGQIRVLTHCNAGALATGGIGTATAPIYLAHESGTPVVVYADETRPLLQGARLTAFELAAGGVDVTLICDSMAAQVMRDGRVQAVITGADRIAANGDAANKIGTYNLAVLARHHGLPFYIAAPSSTFDLTLENGAAIPIEQRSSDEIAEIINKPGQGMSVKGYNPAFDVTPHELITAIITDRGVIEPVNLQQIRTVLTVKR